MRHRVGATSRKGTVDVTPDGGAASVGASAAGWQTDTTSAGDAGCCRCRIKGVPRTYSGRGWGAEFQCIDHTYTIHSQIISGTTSYRTVQAHRTYLKRETICLNVQLYHMKSSGSVPEISSTGICVSARVYSDYSYIIHFQCVEMYVVAG